MILKRDKRFFDVALSIANTSLHHKAKIGAVLVYKKHIISVGVNNCKSHPLQMLYNNHRVFEDETKCPHNTHAELNCILRGENILGTIPKGSRIYIARIWKTGVLGMCRPCNGCAEMLKNRGVVDWYYTTNDGFVYEHIGD